jgi:hypothetical protein
MVRSVNRPLDTRSPKQTMRETYEVGEVTHDDG